MSMTSWAQTLTIGEVGIAEYTYGDDLAEDAVVKDSQGTRLTKGVDYTLSDVAYSDDTFAEEVAPEDMKAGENYYLKITGKGAYANQVKPVYFTVLRADLTIALVANSLDRGYGDDPIPLTADMFGDAVGWKFGQGASAATLLKGNHPTTYTTPDSNFGTKTITFGAGKFADNYNVTYTGTLAIGAKDLTASATITAWQGDVVYTGKDIIGQYTVKTKADGGVVLTPGTPAVLYADVAEYNAAKGTNLGDAAYDALDPAEKIKTPATGDYYVEAAHNVATYRPTITFQGNYTGNIQVADGKGFKVTPAPVTVVINDLEVEYDANDQADQSGHAKLEYSFSGIVGEDITNVTALLGSFDEEIRKAANNTVVAVDGEAINAGDYDLNVSTDAVGVGNYAFTTFIGSTLTIKQKKVELKAKDATKSIGQKDPAFALTNGHLGSLLEGDALSGVTFTREEGEDAGGKYAITPVTTAAKVTHTEGAGQDAVTTDVTANYNIVAAEEKGELTINAGSIVVTILNAEKLYGEVDPEFTFNVRGLQGTDELAEFTIERDKSAADPEAAGAYLLNATVENPNPDKYASVTVVPGILTIKPAQLKLTLPAQNVVFADVTTNPQKVSALKKDVIVATEGINNDDNIADLITLSYRYDYNSDIWVNNKSYDDGYTATLSGAAATNYTIVEVNGKELVAAAAYATGKLIVGTGTGADITLNRAAKEDVDKTAIDEANNAAALIAKYAGEVVTANIGTYEMLPEKWYPIVLPFDVTVSQISSKFDYAVVNVLNKANTDPTKISFKLHMGTIAANTPFVVKVYGDADDHKVDMANGGAIEGLIVAPSDYAAVTSEDAVDASGVKFIGTYLGKTDGFRSNQYYFSASADYNQYYQGNSTNKTYLRPLGAYLQVPDGSAARTIEFEEADGTVTAIKVVKAENGVANAEGWYTIGGVKLQGAPTQKGIYIQNGKKVVVK